MSDPEPTAAGPRRAAKPAEPAARWLDRGSALLLCVAAGSALASATPSLARALGAELPGLAPTEGAPIALPRQPPELLASPDPMFDSDVDPDETQPRSGRARGRLTLHDEPTPTGRPLGDLRAGELVMIVREAGDWVFVVHDGDGGLVTGWAKKSEIAVR